LSCRRRDVDGQDRAESQKAALTKPESRPLFAIVVEGAGERLQFRFMGCPGTRGEPFVEVLQVLAEESAGVWRTVCSLSTGSGGGVLERSWRYGEAVKGMVLEECAALRPGLRYVVHGLGSGTAQTSFTISVSEGRTVSTTIHGGC
jgi:hypothetical protein